MRNLIQNIGWLGVGVYITVSAVIISIIAMALEKDPVSVKKVGVDFTVAYPGERKKFSRLVCSSKDIKVVVTRNIVRVDEFGNEHRAGDLSLTGYNISRGCVEDDYFLPISDDYEPGVYIYKPSATYDINAIQLQFNKPLEEIVFTVIDRDSL